MSSFCPSFDRSSVSLDTAEPVTQVSVPDKATRSK